MENSEIMSALKESYREVQARKRLRFFGNTGNLAVIRRYLLYAADILGVFLDIQRDRRYRGEW